MAKLRRKYRDEEEDLIKPIQKGLLKRLLYYLLPYKWNIIIAFVLTIIISALSAVRPRLTPVAIDEKIPSGDVIGLLLVV